MGHYPELIGPSSYELRYSRFGKVMIIFEKNNQEFKINQGRGGAFGNMRIARIE